MKPYHSVPDDGNTDGLRNAVRLLIDAYNIRKEFYKQSVLSICLYREYILSFDYSPQSGRHRYCIASDNSAPSPDASRLAVYVKLQDSCRGAKTMGLCRNILTDL